MIEFSVEAYTLWLQAQRPPMDWFMAQTEDAQQEMANEGLFHRAGTAIEIAEALHDPQKFCAEWADEDDEEADSVIVARLAAKAVGEMLGGAAPQPASIPPQGPAVPPSLTMAGALQRCDEASERDRQDVGQRRTFLGRKSDAFRDDEVIT